MDIVWLRDDFRLDDQPAIAAAALRPALFVYVHDEAPWNGRPPGGAAPIVDHAAARARAQAAFEQIRAGTTA